MSETKKKGWFVKHAKSSAAVISLAIHAVLILAAVSFVAFTVIQKEDQTFEARPVNRPRQKLRKLQVPVNIKKQAPQPKLRKRIVVEANQRSTPDFQMPEIAGVKGGMGGTGLGISGMESIGFSMPEIDYFGAKAKGETFCFVVHFGPQAVGNTPATRMTGYVIRKRMQELIDTLPGVALFNTFAYYQNGGGAMNPTLLAATPKNKQRVAEWMASANPLEGDYKYALDMFEYDWSKKSMYAAAEKWPYRVDDLPWYSLKWLYPYEVPQGLQQKYCPEKPLFQHWVRGVAWAALEQKADTIFVLTTNYIDFFGELTRKWDNPNQFEMKGKPQRTAEVFEQIFRDVYGSDKKNWPTVNVIVLSWGKETDLAYATLGAFEPLITLTKGSGSVIEDIRKFMNDEEEALYKKYSRE